MWSECLFRLLSQDEKRHAQFHGRNVRKSSSVNKCWADCSSSLLAMKTLIPNFDNKIPIPVHKNYYYMVIQDTFVIKWQMGPVLSHHHINAIGIYSTPLIFSTLSCYLNTCVTQNTMFYYTSFELALNLLTNKILCSQDWLSFFFVNRSW